MVDLDKMPLDELSALVTRYPWFGAARKEMCLRMSRVGGEGWGSRDYATSALYVGSRRIISDIVRTGKANDYSDRNLEDLIKSYTVGEAVDFLNAAEDSLHLREKEIVRPFTLRELIDNILTEDTYADLRSRELIRGITVESLLTDLAENEKLQSVLDKEVGKTVTLGQVLDFLHADEALKAAEDKTLNQPVTLGQIADLLKDNSALQSKRDKTISLTFTVGDIFDLFGEENIKALVEEKTAAASRKPEYEQTVGNIARNWAMLFVFIVFFAMLSTIALELIDKDKR